MEGRVINYSDIVHNFCVQIWVGRVGGEGNLVNDNKCSVFFSGTTPYSKFILCIVSQLTRLWMNSLVKSSVKSLVVVAQCLDHMTR